MKWKTAASLAVAALALVACGEEKIAREAEPAPIAKIDEALKPAQPAQQPEPVAAPEPPPKATEPAAPTAGEIAQPDVVRLALEGAEKGAVTFPHEMHVGLPIMDGKCRRCHHTTDESGAGAGKCTAAGCHEGRGKNGAKDAFHDLCRGCHEEALGRQPGNEKLKRVKSCKGCHVG
ncbi:MAG: cytochrome c family protein [Proteobacteria bacterium]|jgi:hypothetical protein|nr:cytochrome c family protein [Pseudomonadota bacterium]